MNSPLSLLLIDDDADDRDFFLEAVREIDPAISCTTTIDGPSGLSYLEYVTVITEVSRICGAIGLSVAAHNSLCTGHILQFGNV